MTDLEFNLEIKRMQDHCAKSLTKEQAESWFHYLRKFSRKALRLAVDDVNGNSDGRLPTFGRVIDLVTIHEPRPRRMTIETEVHPNQAPLARFCLTLLDCFTYESIQTVLNTACESRKDLTDIYVKMSKARFETLPRTAPQYPQLGGEPR